MNLRRFSNHTLGVSHDLLEVAVTARLQAVTEGVTVAVEDAGHGIEPEERMAVLIGKCLTSTCSEDR
jgi:hypothetical protein